MNVAIATCTKLPEPDSDEPLLREALAHVGISSTMVAWDGATCDLSSFDACIIRSTWNYIWRVDEFVAWADEAARATHLYNPAPIARWNTHKKYLNDLAAHGVHVVPTMWIDRVDRADPETIVRDAFAHFESPALIIKPQVGAGSFATRLFHENERDEASSFLAQSLTTHDAMIQPYVRSVEDYGERSLVWIDGEFTHAIRKSRRLAGDIESVSGPVAIGDDELRLAEAALAPYAGDLLYARVDVARGDSGTPMIMELELVEPSLFFREAPHALHRFASAIRGRIESQEAAAQRM